MNRLILATIFASCLVLAIPGQRHANAQNVQATWSPSLLLPDVWAPTPDWQITSPSNWSMGPGGESHGFPSNGNFPGTYFDAIIGSGYQVTVLPLLPISISNLSIASGSDLVLVDGADFYIQDTGNSGLVNCSGNIIMLNTGGALATEMYLDGNIRFTGGGKLLMDDSPSVAIRGNTAFGPNAILTLEDFTIEGAGNVGSNELSIFVQSGSLIRASGSNRMTIDPINGGNGLINEGVLQARGGALRLFDGGFHNVSGVIEASFGGVVEIANANINGGAFESSGSGLIRALGGASLSGPITNNARFEIPATTLLLSGDLTNTNQVLIGNESTSGVLIHNFDTMLDGGGEIIMSNQPGNRIDAVFNTTSRFTNVDNTIRGSGLIGGRFTNAGTIRADQATPLIFQATDIAGGGINQGLMEAVSGGTLRLHISTIENLGGEIRANGGTVLLTGSATIQDGTLNVVGNGRVEFSDGTIDAVTNNSSQGVIATVSGSGNYLTGLVFNPLGGTILVNDDTRLNLDAIGNYNNAGTIRLDGSGSLPGFAGTRLMLDGDVFLQGGGDIDMSNAVSNTIEARTGNPGVDTLVNVDHRIHGAGNIGRNTLAIHNNGIIEADLPFVDSEAFGTIAIDPGGGGVAGIMTNVGVVRASGGGRIQLLNGLYENAGGLFEATAGSTVELNEAVTIRGGTIRSSGSGMVHVPRNATLDGIGLTLDADTLVDGIGRLSLIGSIENQKTITLDATHLRFSQTVTLSGGGNIVLADDPNSQLTIFSSSATDRLINIDNTISGAGKISFLGITNQGTVRADGVNELYYQGGSGFDNQGRLEVVGTGGMQLVGQSFTTSGQVTIGAGSRLRRDGNYIQTAGNTEVNGTLEVTSGNSISFLGGTLSGNGNLIGNVQVNGTVAPGHSPGILNFTGTTLLNGMVETEFATELVDGGLPDLQFVNTAIDPALTGFDQINVFNSLTLADGLTFEISFIDGYVPQLGDFFDIVTANFITQAGSLNFFYQTPSGAIFDEQLLRLFDPGSGVDRDVLRLSVVQVPEPGCGLSFVLVMSMLGINRRHRRV